MFVLRFSANNLEIIYRVTAKKDAIAIITQMVCLDIAKSSRLDKSEKMQECVALLEDCLAKASQFQPQKIAHNGCSMDSKYVNYRNA